MNFLIEHILNGFFIFSCAFMIVKGTYHGNKIDKLAKVMWPQFPTEVLQIMTGIG